jgi:hypothetical protein
VQTVGRAVRGHAYVQGLAGGKRGVVYADSSGALAIPKRKGSGKLRHINIGLLWIQEKESKKELAFVKVDGAVNPADLMTKHVPAGKVEAHSRKMRLKVKEGTAQAGLKVQGRKRKEELKRLRRL